MDEISSSEFIINDIYIYKFDCSQTFLMRSNNLSTEPFKLLINSMEFLYKSYINIKYIITSCLLVSNKIRQLFP